eukprot:2031948-Amphidinium_carterae.1
MSGWNTLITQQGRREGLGLGVALRCEAAFKVSIQVAVWSKCATKPKQNRKTGIKQLIDHLHFVRVVEYVVIVRTKGEKKKVSKELFCWSVPINAHKQLVHVSVLHSASSALENLVRLARRLRRQFLPARTSHWFSRSDC